MNKTFNLVWSAVRGAYIVAHECAKFGGRPSLAGQTLRAVSLTLSLLGGAGAAMAGPPTPTVPAPNALPTGGQVTAGSASIAQNANRMDVTQSSQKAAINWQTFNIGAAAQVNFAQPNANAVALNRVLSSDPSAIYGKLTSNGQVFLINQAGVLFGAGSRVDVGGLVASTMNVTDADFMAGSYKFTSGSGSNGVGSVLNLGTLTAAQGGYVALLAPEVRNEGVITANLGQVVLGAADAVTLSMDASGLQYAVDQGAVQALVDNKGLVQAEGGQVLLSARAANTLASAVINNSGTVEAKGLVAKGGRIVLESDSITLANGSKLDASGATGGGTVLVGGDWQGSGSTYQATTVTMVAGTSIDASATQSGDGGKVVLWSDVGNANSHTTVAGSIRAEGAGGGAGGQVETSGHKLSIADSARVATGGGQSGLWLLDPFDFTIGTGGDITGAALQTALEAGAGQSVSISTQVTSGLTAPAYYGTSGSSGDIILNNSFSWSKGTLVLDANRSILVNNAVNVTGTGSLTVRTNLGGYTNDQGGTREGYLKTKQTRSGLTGPDTFTGKINWTSTGALTMGGTAYTQITDTVGLATISGSNKYFLANDITSVGAWTPKANFSGTLEGLGHTISGLTIASAPTSAIPVGIFKNTTAGAIIQNVGLVNSSITCSTNFCYVGTGAFIGSIDDTTKLQNVFTAADTTVSYSGPAGTTGSWFGGLVGSANNGWSTQGPFTLRDSYNAASVNAGASGTQKLSGSGGLVGYINQKNYIFESYNVGQIVGGSVANKDTPSSLGDGIGGVIGTLKLSYSYNEEYLRNIKNYGAVYGGTGVGGIMASYATAYANNDPTGGQQKLYNYGAIQGVADVGGIVGTLFSGVNPGLNTLAIESASNSGAIEATTQNAGGIVGHFQASISSQNATLRATYNSGTVTAPTYVGGLAGYVQGGTFNIFYSYNSGAVSATTGGYAGGLVGVSIGAGGSYSQIYNRGTVSSSGIYSVGSIYGDFENTADASFSNAYAVTGNVTNNIQIGYYKIGAALLTNVGTGQMAGLADKTPAQMQTATLATLGFNSGIWSGGGDGTNPGLYPYLQGFTTPLSYTLSTIGSGTYTYNGNLLTLSSVWSASSIFGASYSSWVAGTDYEFKYGGSTVAGWTNAGTYSSITVNILNSGYSSSGGTAGSLTIDPKSVTLTGSKTYDGTATSAGATLTVSNKVGSDAVNVTNGGTATIASRNVGNRSLSNSTGLSLDNANYTLTGFSGAITVNAAPITISTSNVTKTYDGGTTASGTATVTSGALGTGDTLSGGSFAFTNKDAGSNKTVTAGSVTVNDGNSGNNYTVSYASNTTSTINAKALTMSGLSVPASKVYDSTTTAVVSGTAALLSAEAVGNGTTSDGKPYSGDTVNITGTATGTYNNKNVASATTVTFGGLALDNSNYTLTIQSPASATITAKPLTMSGLSVPSSKVYDGTTTAVVSGSAALASAEATGSGSSVDGKPYTGDTVSLTGTAAGTYDSKDVTSATSVTYSGLSLTGTQAGNYNLSIQGSSAATITPKALAMSGLSVPTTKVYDATTTAVVSGTPALTGSEAVGSGSTADGKWYTGDTVAFTGTAVGTYNGKDVTNANGNQGTSITFSGLGLSNSNYSLTIQSPVSATITTKTLGMSGLSVPSSKVYDGTRSAVVTDAKTLQIAEAAGGGSTADGKPYSGDTVNLSGTTVGTYDTKDVATASSVTYSGLSLTGAQAGNYSLSIQDTSAATITPKTLGVLAAKTYDGSTDLTGHVILTTGITGSTLNYSGATASSKDVIDNAANFVSAITLQNGSDLASNYQLPSLNVGNAPVTISPKSVTLTAPSISKTFDDTTGFTTTATELSNLSAQLGVAGDTVTAVTLTYGNEDAGIGHTVTPTLAAISSGNSNYTLTYANNASSVILAKTLTLAGLTGVNKTYDGTTAMPVGNSGYGALTGVVGTAPVTLSGALAYDQSNAGSRSVLIGSLALQGPEAGNYTLSWTDGSGNIAKAPLTVSANADAKFVTKLDITGYNGASYTGLVHGETSGVLGGTLTITRNNPGVNGAGNYPNVLVPAGLSSGNYEITFANGTYTIVPADQLLVRVQNTATTYGTDPGYSVTSAQYMDGNNVIQTLGTPGVTGNTYTYSDGAGGTAVFTLGPVAPQASGAGQLKAGNYAIGASNVAETSANFNGNLTVVGDLAVNQKPLTPSASNVSKVYDGNTSMNGVTLGLSGLVSGDAVTVSGNGAFAQSNVGNSLGYTISSVTLGSVDASNYYLANGNTLTGNDGAIARKTVSLTATRTYDGTNLLGANTVQIDTGVAGETLTYSAATAHTKNVGSGNYINAITLSDNAVDAVDPHDGWASNYQLPSMTAASASNSVSFAQKVLAISGITAADKTYDGGTVASVSVAGVTATALQTGGMVTGDNITVAATGNFRNAGNTANDKNVGTDKTVLLVSSYGGTDLGNYTVTDQATTTASIAKRDLTISGITAADKTYDGNDLATVSTSAVLKSGLVSGDDLSVAASGTFSDKNAASGKTVTLVSTHSGADVGNYRITNQPSTTASITPKDLTVASVSAANKTYDGLTNAVLTLGNLVGLVSNESLGLSGKGDFENANVGIDKTVFVKLALANSSNGLASNYRISDTTTKAKINPVPNVVPPLPPSVPTTGSPAPGGTPTTGADPTGTPAPGGTPTTGGTPGTGSDPRGTPAPGGAPAPGGTPTTGGDSSGTPPGDAQAPAGTPIGTPAPSGTPSTGADPTGTPITGGTPGTGGDPTGSPAPSSTPTTGGTPSTGGTPTGTPALGGTPIPGGTSATGGAPTGTPASSGTPTPGSDPAGTTAPGGTPGTAGDLSGTPAPSGTPTTDGDPTGTSSPGGTPNKGGDLTLETGFASGQSNGTGSSDDTGNSNAVGNGGDNLMQLTLTPMGEIQLKVDGAGSAERSSSDAVGASTISFVSVRSFGALDVLPDSGFSFTLPRDTFRHADPKASIVLVARLLDGRPLPSWLRFDGANARFSGTVPKGWAQSLDVVVVASDSSGNQASTKITLRFKGLR